MAKYLLALLLLLTAAVFSVEEIDRIEKTIRNYEYHAKQAERDARRIGYRDRGHAMHLRRHARWLRSKVLLLQEDLDVLKSIEKEKSPGSE